MFECDVWIDLECKNEDHYEVVCTLLASHTFPTRPLVGESISYHPRKGSNRTFNVPMSWGPMQTGHISTEVEDVSHYRAPLANGDAFKTSLRCKPVRLETIVDAQSVVAYLTSEHGFELDPYGTNKL